MSNWGSTKVPSVGPVCIIGESPGQKEEELLVPFSGSAGKVLDDLLLEAGLSREECYITNVVKVRPKNNDFSLFYENKEPTELLKSSIIDLQREIMTVRPNIVVLLGNEALKAVVGINGITKWRGSILKATLPDQTIVKCISTFHPAAVLRNWEYRPICLFDFNRIAKESKTNVVDRMNRTLITNPDYTTVIKELDRLSTSEYVAFDIETETSQITCIGFSDSPGWAICVPFWYGASGSLWAREQELEIWCKIKALLEGSNKKIAQNAQYDITMLADLMDIHVNNLWIDTMIAGHLAYPEMPKGLDFLTSIYTDQPYYKDWIHKGDMEQYWRYNCLDACCTYEVAFGVKKELEDLGMWVLYSTYIHKLIEPLISISRYGIKIDLPLRQLAVKQHEDIINTKQHELDSLVGHELNVSSPKQMAQWMYKDMGYKPKYKRRIGNGSSENTVTVDEEAIQDIARVNPRKEFNLVLEIRALKKILSTYLRAKLDKDNRIRTTYLITGTETGRLASRESVHGTGTNLQNVPKGIARRLFIPDSYKLFVSGDLSQAEARVVAYLAGEDALIRLFESGGDIHRKNASSIFRVQEASVTDKQRQLAKRVVHASNYGMGPITFAKNAGISVQEAKRLLNAYFATYPGIKLWHMATVTRLNKSRMLTTPFGRKRLFMGTYNESLKKVAYAYVPQSTVSDILNTGLLNVYDEISSMDAQILLQVHDSIVVQCLPDDFQRICLIIKNSLERSIKIKGIDGVVRDCRIPCDLQAGWNWDELDTVVSPFNVVPDKHVGGVHGG